MREEGLQRLHNLKPALNSKDYLVLHYLVQDLRNAIGQFGGRRVFDIGCGNKPYEPFFEAPGLLYRGCDVVQSNLNKVDVVCEASQIPEPDANYDTVLCTQVLEHVTNPDAVTAEAYRLLAPGGHFILSVPFAWELHEAPYDFYRYSKYGISELLTRHGFEVLLVKANGGKWAAVFQLNLNMIYSSFQYPGVFRKLLKGLFLHGGLTALFNTVAKWADRKWHDELLTLNYVVVARKLT
jgi:SAM-dependent methyltransferase